MSNDYFKAQGWFKNYARSSEDSRGVFQQLVKEDEEAFRLASAESDKLKEDLNKKLGAGTIKYGSEISQPPARPDVIEIDLFNDFMKRNPAAEGGRIPFKYAGPVKFENIIKPKIYEGNRFSKKLPKGTFTMRLYMGLDADGNRIEETFTGTKKELKKIFDKNNKARVKGDLPTMGESKVYEVRQGKNKGKFAIKMPKDSNYSFFDTEVEAEKYKTDYLNDPANKVGGDRRKKVTPPDGYVSGKEMLEEAKKKKIYVGENRQASNFADVFGFPKTTKNGQMFFDINKLNNEEAVDAILKSQVKSGSATKEAKEKFPVKTKTELQTPRLEAIEAQGGVKKNDPYAGKRGSGIELGHTGNIYGTELITGDRLAYTPTEVNQLMGKEGNLDDKIRSVSAKIENIKASDKPANVKKDLLEQADNILIRLASQSQGFKKVTLSGGGTFGGDRFTIDPFNTYPGKTEKEIQKIQKKYLGKQIITEGPNKTPPEEIQKIQDAFFFEKNRKEVMKASKKIGKKEIKKIKENIDIDFIDGKKDFVGFSSGFNTDLLMKDPAVQKILNSKAGQAVKNAAKGTAGSVGKVFGVADILIGVLDYENNISKGQKPDEALGNAVQAMSFGLYKSGDRARIADVKERFVAKGGDGEIFDQATALNAKDQEINDLIYKSKFTADKAFMDLSQPQAILGKSTDQRKKDYELLKKSLNEKIRDKVEERDNMIKSYKTNLQVSEAGAPIQIGGQEFFSQPFKDIKRSTMEKIEEENKEAYDMQKRQLVPTAGNIGNWLLNNVFTMNPQERAQMQKYINEMDEKELYKFNLERGMDPDNLIRFEDILNYKTTSPELMGVNTTKYINKRDQKSEGGITELRSKYEYKK